MFIGMFSLLLPLDYPCVFLPLHWGLRLGLHYTGVRVLTVDGRLKRPPVLIEETISEVSHRHDFRN